MKGSYPSITQTYSKQLRDLISSMLSVKPQNRPTIIDVINKPFIKKRAEKFMMDMFNRNTNSAVDNDDIYLDTLR
jgi:serine/threonine protein kinase